MAKIFFASMKGLTAKDSLLLPLPAFGGISLSINGD